MNKNCLIILTISIFLISCSSESPETTSEAPVAKTTMAEPTVTIEVVEEATIEEDAHEVEKGTSNGTISKLELKGVVIHSYTAPEDSEVVNSHIIETANSLVIIDMQLLRPYAKQLRAYADQLDKPIDRVILTHQHPDHWFGYESFAGTPIYAQQEVIDGLGQVADFYINARRKELGELVPESKSLPDHVLAKSSESIDGLQYEFKLVSKAEAGVQTVITLPEHSVIIVGDLLSNNAHSFYGGGMAQPWVGNLKTMAEGPQYEHILVGHGQPPATNHAAFAWQITYLETAIQALQATTSEETLATVKTAYPDLDANGMAALSAQFFHNVVKPRMEKQKQQAQIIEAE
jgi:hypothetical protein